MPVTSFNGLHERIYLTLILAHYDVVTLIKKVG
jgi:hypothetical protein